MYAYFCFGRHKLFTVNVTPDGFQQWSADLTSILGAAEPSEQYFYQALTGAGVTHRYALQFSYMATATFDNEDAASRASKEISRALAADAVLGGDWLVCGSLFEEVQVAGDPSGGFAPSSHHVYKVSWSTSDQVRPRLWEMYDSGYLKRINDNSSALVSRRFERVGPPTISDYPWESLITYYYPDREKCVALAEYSTANAKVDLNDWEGFHDERLSPAKAAEFSLATAPMDRGMYVTQGG
jgi:hypothetical protein